MNVCDVVIDGLSKRHIIAHINGQQLELVCVTTGKVSTGVASDYKFFRVATELEAITAFEAGPDGRELLRGLPCLERFFKGYRHRGDDAPSILYRY